MYWPFWFFAKLMIYNSVSQQVGRDPLLGRGQLLLGRQNLCYSTMIVLFGSPNCVFLCFVGHQLPNVENHCFRATVITPYLTWLIPTSLLLNHKCTKIPTNAPLALRMWNEFSMNLFPKTNTTYFLKLLRWTRRRTSNVERKNVNDFFC